MQNKTQHKQADIRFDNDRIFVLGDLDFSNVMSVYARSLTYLNQQTQLNFDFSQLNSTNSAGIALIVEWLKFAKAHRKPIHFYHLPADVNAIAKAAHIENILAE